LHEKLKVQEHISRTICDFDC